MAGTEAEGKVQVIGAPVALSEVQSAAEICEAFKVPCPMALVASAHEAVAHGINMVGGFSNSGEGGEHFTRYGTVRASRIKRLLLAVSVWTAIWLIQTLKSWKSKSLRALSRARADSCPVPK